MFYLLREAPQRKPLVCPTPQLERRLRLQNRIPLHDVLQSRLNQLRIILQPADCAVAVRAQQTTNFTSDMAMVNCRVGDPTYKLRHRRTHTALLFKQSRVLFGGQVVTTLGVAFA